MLINLAPKIDGPHNVFNKEKIPEILNTHSYFIGFRSTTIIGKVAL
jgi:hypothetical protein